SDCRNAEPDYFGWGAYLASAPDSSSDLETICRRVSMISIFSTYVFENLSVKEYSWFSGLKRYVSWRDRDSRFPVSRLWSRTSSRVNPLLVIRSLSPNMSSIESWRTISRSVERADMSACRQISWIGSGIRFRVSVSVIDVRDLPSLRAS